MSMIPKSGYRFSDKIMLKQDGYTTTVSRFAARVIPV